MYPYLLTLQHTPTDQCEYRMRVGHRMCITLSGSHLSTTEAVHVNNAYQMIGKELFTSLFRLFSSLLCLFLFFKPVRGVLNMAQFR